MAFLEQICNPNIKNLERPLHGGNIFKKFSKNLEDWKNVIDFSTNVNPLGPSKEAIKAIQDNIWQISYYPESTSQILREELVNFYNKKISSSSIIVSSGLTELINLTAEVFIKPKTKVLIPIPTYDEYAWAVKKFGGIPAFHYLNSEENFQMNKIFESLTQDITALFICNPNNPTARLENSNFLKEVVEAAKKKDILVCVDEAFIDYCDSNSSLVLDIKQNQNLIVFRSFTKFFALTGLRISYGVADEKIINLLMKAKLSWNVNCLAQTAAVCSLKDRNFIEQTLRLIKNEKKFLFESLKRMNGIKVYPSDTGFILFQLMAEINPKEFEKRLLENNIMIRNCGSFQGLNESFFRIGIKFREDNEKLINIMNDILKNI